MYRETGRRLDVLRTSDAVVCYSSAVERHLEVNGIKSSWRVPLFSELVEAPATYDAEGPITYIGRIVQAKGVDILIRAAPLLNREVAIFGDGWAADGLRDLVAANGVEDRVTFHGWASPSVRESAYQAASVVAVPSRWPEPFGLVGLEAFAHARPVVASETGGISDWLEHGVSGLQVDVSRPDELANAINRIINDPALGERMGQAGRRSSMERFSPDAHVRELEKVYAAVKR
jgi:glycosyltransferase involved in cell wall biosynthesis